LIFITNQNLQLLRQERELPSISRWVRAFVFSFGILCFVLDENSEVTEERTIHLQKPVRWLDTNLHSFRCICGGEQY